MGLLSIFASDPESVTAFSIEQVVSTAGDGALKDHSECSSEVREYIRQIGTPKIANYVEHCLSISFSKSGMVLQDLVNELGRRLDYDVTNGLYQGTVNKVGFDGLWHSPEGHTLVVEVKTTDAYRMSLDTFAKYRRALADDGTLAQTSSILIVVGRQDTGELEAQIRGSRHAWDMRVISVDALIKLVSLKENTEAPETGLQIRSILSPIEYTRLDRVIDVMFTAAADVEEAAEVDAQNQDSAESESAPGKGSEKSSWEFTPSNLLQAKRDQIVSALGKRQATNLIRKSRALYWSPDRQIRAACAISKRYTGKNQAPYWYAFHPQWDSFLTEGEQAFFVLGCMDLDTAFALPRETIKGILPHLNTTTKEETYWHIHLVQQGGGLAISLPRKGSSLPLAEYALSLS